MNPIDFSSRRLAARKGWETRKANEARRAKRFDEVLAENRKLNEQLRSAVRNEDGSLTIKIDAREIVEKMPALTESLKAAADVVTAYDMPVATGDIFGPIQRLRRALADLMKEGT